MRRSLLLLVLVFGVGCAGSLPEVRGLHDTLRARIHEAKFLGGISCSPDHLAQAQVAYRFATLEISQGDLARAEDHVRSGLDHANKAVERGIACNDRGLAVDDPTKDPWADQDGDGVADAEDSCPYALEDVDEYEDRDGCPEPDNDRDGLLDLDDSCPNSPEDLDGYKDEDGCPDHDNDEDGVADAQDQCPNSAETINQFEDDDGCPDFRPLHLTVSPDRLEPKEPLVFADGMGLLLAHSHPALKEVAQLMAAQPDVKLKIVGHTDNRGDPARLQALSDSRAKAVLEFLANAGVARERLSSEGLGDTDPLGSNRTPGGRKLNNRIELLAVEGAFE
jgi:outer membrane protein OmpA-like peptidoglycan-associated protein